MATKKEIEAAQKKAKKDLKAKKAASEKKSQEKKLETLATISSNKTVVPEEVVSKGVEKEKSTPVIQTEEDEISKLREQLEIEKRLEKKRGNKDDWDVKKDDPIEYFDPELSYELTGYRPITMTKGLDFDPTPFTIDATTYNRTGSYCTYRNGSKLHKDFWAERMNRCKYGYTVGRYSLTGDHYYFLNFYRLLNVNNVQKAAEGRLDDFPTFFSKQYEYFHYIELCERLGKDVGALKARGVNKPALL